MKLTNVNEIFSISVIPGVSVSGNSLSTESKTCVLTTWM